ncbi:MAG: arylsulfatase A-like enzyme, partial [Planctomycetota bacterium]
MKPLLKALPLFVIVLAALEAARLRIDLPYRPQDSGLFLQAALLWGIYGALGLLPAALVLRQVGGAQAEGDRWVGSPVPFLVLAGVVACPVLLHQRLDRYVGLGGSLETLKSLWPWLDLAVTLVLWVSLLWVLGQVFKRARIGSGRVALLLGLGALVVGLFLPWRGSGKFIAANVASTTSPPADRPNVLLLVWDTVRARSATPFGYDRDTTPHLAELSEQSTVYEDARSVSCFTFTSHLSMFSGVLPSKHGGRLTSMGYRLDRADHVARAFQEAGYRTGGFVGTDVLSGRTGIRYGFERYDDQVDPLVCDTLAWSLLHDIQAFLGSRVPAFANNGLPHWIQDFQRPGDQVLDEALSWINQADERPWFCMVNLYDAHWPYLPKGAGKEQFVGDYDGPLDGYFFRSDAWVDGYEIQPADAAHLVDLYDAEINDLDLLVDGFLDQLSLDLGGTAVLMTADHGEAFGEAGVWKHEDIFEPQVHIPFLVRTAEVTPEGRRVGGFVSGIDVAPTLLGLAGLDELLGKLDMDGLNLASADPTPERVILVEDRDHMDPLEVTVVLYSGPWKLVRRGLGEEKHYSLHDLRTDQNGTL